MFGVLIEGRQLMCGFVGLIRPHISSIDAEFPQDLLKMVKGAGIKLKPRGPDQSGLWSDASCALVHHRLHVIGSSDEGRQPIRDSTDRYVMVYNGAVYNFRNLGRGLDLDSLSDTSCDTNTVLEGFVKHQKDWFRQLNGMFAIAIWDQQEQELWLARDRFGQKPLYYGQGHSGFIFGSELKALLPLMEGRPQANYKAIHHYLSFGYIPTPFTGFTGLSKLEAGHFLRIKLGTNNQVKQHIQKYFQNTSKSKKQSTFQDLRAELFSRLERATERCMVSSQPLGSFLSGGVDSSAVTAMIQRKSSQSVKTFSVGFEAHGFDERLYAKNVANYLETDHHEIVFEDKNIIQYLEKLSSIYDEPFGDSSALPMMLLSQTTRQHVTVAMSGDGADELFMGYPRHLEMARQQKLTNLPKSVYKLSKIMGSITRNKRFQNLAVKGNVISKELYLSMIFQFEDKEKRTNYTKMMAELNLIPSHDLLDENFTGDLDFVEEALLVDQNYYLPDDILTKSDRAAMAMSLEVRTPFLDNDLIDFSQSLPWSLKCYDGRLKALLKDSVASMLPLETLNRPKQGFSVPLKKWLNGPLKDYVRDILLSDKAFILTLLSRSYIEQLLNSTSQQNGQYYNKVWSILILELWAKKWLAP